MIKLLNIINEAAATKETFEEFAETRGKGAAKIAATAEEKGGLKSLMSSGIMNTKIDPKGNGLGLASLLKKAVAS